MFTQSDLIDCGTADKHCKRPVLVQYIDEGLSFAAIDCMVHRQEIQSDRRELVLASSPF